VVTEPEREAPKVDPTNRAGKCTTVRLNDVRTFVTAFLGGFLGKISAAIVLAICALFGFGPDWIAKTLVSTPFAVIVLRVVFLVLGASVLAFGPTRVLVHARHDSNQFQANR